MKKEFVFIAFALVISSGLVFAAGCVDDDGGRNIDEAGHAMGSDNLGFIDGCDYTKGLGVLKEAVCSGNTAIQVEIECPDDKPYCNEAVCSETYPECVDSDGGDDPSVRGTIDIPRLNSKQIGMAFWPDHGGIFPDLQSNLPEPIYVDAVDYCENLGGGLVKIAGAEINTHMQPWYRITKEPCKGPDCGLREYFCLGTEYGFRDIPCPNGCIDGRCVDLDGDGNEIVAENTELDLGLNDEEFVRKVYEFMLDRNAESDSIVQWHISNMYYLNWNRKDLIYSFYAVEEFQTKNGLDQLDTTTPAGAGTFVEILYQKFLGRTANNIETWNAWGAPLQVGTLTREDVAKGIIGSDEFRNNFENFIIPFSCEDNCGDGICDDETCVGGGCPCIEDENSCFVDCGGETQEEQAAEPTTPTVLCSEDDERIDFFKKSKTSNSTYSGIDFCSFVQEENVYYVYEFYCDGNSVMSLQKKCDDICSGGKCTTQQQVDDEECETKYSCVIKPSICPDSGIQIKYCEDDNCDAASYQEEVICNPGTCSGCEYDGECIPYGFRKKLTFQNKEGEYKVYCDTDGILRGQKQDWEECQNNFECISNACSAEECIGVVQAIQRAGKFKSLSAGVLCRISRIFNLVEDVDECVADMLS